VGIDVDHASRVANLTNLEAKALPIASLSLASSYAGHIPAIVGVHQAPPAGPQGRGSASG